MVWQARCQHLCDMLLLALPTQMGPMFTWRWVSSYVGPRFCDIMHGLLQHHSCWGIQVYHRFSKYWMLPLASSATRRSTTADSAISCTTSCIGWTFLSGCSTSCVQRSIDVCSTKHHSTWRAAASTPQTLLVGSICGPPAAISCSYRDTGVWSSVLFCGRPVGLELVTRLPARSVTFLWQFLPVPQNFSCSCSFLVLLAYTVH